MSQLTERERSRRPLLRRPATVILMAVLLVLLVIGLWAFQPWKAFTRSTLDEALPTADIPAAPAAPAEPAPAEPVTPTEPAAPAEPAVLAEGEFITQEHETTGVARVIELPDGSRYVRLENFSTSDGPDVHVWLTDQDAGGDWGKYEDGRYLPLGKLRATDGNQNYPVPADAELSGFTSVVIWCDRFNVSFGSAPVTL